jgi:hypothetical protein
LEWPCEQSIAVAQSSRRTSRLIDLHDRHKAATIGTVNSSRSVSSLLTRYYSQTIDFYPNRQKTFDPEKDFMLSMFTPK